jgi:phosphopantothenoylcysteine decarboxylase/phosphopantothenate--cysteine ligase
MHQAMLEAAVQADVVVMAAAVADYAPVTTSADKMKKSGNGAHIELRETVDILAALAASKPFHQMVVGFAAETGDSAVTVLEYGRDKLARKGCDALVVNDVRGDLAFGSDTNEVTVITAHSETHISRRPKRQIARAIWDSLLAQRQH